MTADASPASNYQAASRENPLSRKLSKILDTRLENDKVSKCRGMITYPDHLLLDSAPNLGPLISRWEINKFKNC
jgi:hypothetical protein